MVIKYMGGSESKVTRHITCDAETWGIHIPFIFTAVQTVVRLETHMRLRVQQWLFNMGTLFEKRSRTVVKVVSDCAFREY